MKILVASSNQSTRKTLVNVLESTGYSPIEAEDGHAAARLIKSDSAARIIISDWNLQGVDGPTLCKAAKVPRTGLATAPYCVLVTPHATFGETVLSLDLGADDYLPAVFNTEELLSCVRAACRIVILEDQLSSARTSLEFVTTHDHVSGAFNRAGLQQHLVREMDRTRRFGTTLGVILVGIDHFRIINENFGCFAADAVLHEVACRIQSVVRAYDIVGRYGADEFLILSPETSVPSLMLQAERLLTTVSRTPIAYGNSEILATASIGVATSDDRSEQELLSVAEAALNTAKRTGRNNVRFARDFMPETLSMMPFLVASSRPN